MEISQFTEEVERLTATWQDKRLELMVMLLAEEVGELSRSLRKNGRKRWGHDDEPIGSEEDVHEELGDVLFLLGRIALMAGVDMDAAAQRVLAKIVQRTAAEAK